MRVIGTAGHVDHGKSALVKALTGVDPDRLKEEQERGMTIDLGFGWLTLPGGETVSVVDVPGHEDFISNMLAGVGGIDAALLVVAVDDGVMPQTREHLAILDLLQVKSGIVALTKVDLIDDPEWLDMVTADIVELLDGTCLAGAEVVPVSAKTGQGVAELAAKLERLLQATALRLDLGRPRLAIDRVFSMAGFGTVVTGTLIDGRLNVGQEVEILPQALKARIRGLQVHKHKVQEALPGSRVAINLTGVDIGQLTRGQVVTTPGWLEPTHTVGVQLQLLASAPKPLRHGAEVEFFSGSAQIMARVRLLGADEIAPGHDGWAQLLLHEQAALERKDRFIIRQPSPSLTIGGGVVLDPHLTRRLRRSRPETVERLETLAHGTPEEALLEALRRQEPCTMRDLVQKSGLPSDEAQACIARLLEGGQIMVLGGEARDRSQPPAAKANLISASGWTALLDRLTGLLAEYHRQYPLRPGMPREEVKSRLRLDVRAFNEAVELAIGQGKVAGAEAILRLPDHEVRFAPEDRAAVNALLGAHSKNPYSPPTISEAEAQVGADVLAALLDKGMLTRVSADICFLPQVYERMVQQVVQHIKQHGGISVGQARDMFGTSRKYVLPFLEHLDEIKVTKRVGDDRVLW
ncbi:MAG TPA: selenocysteine-specific translation elongation factor [Anaerolineae bacterium]|nr:selenocysteine-specific translation elongation factor [Anaerolineae bacterium]HPL28681.1 selenocysteine-specific translation elongation factor [Anaerolineae bacterium]